MENDIIYLTIPNKYYNLYQKLLNALADFGKTIIDNCNNNTSLNVINCWNLFQSALACNELGDEEKSLFFMNYINKQLDIIYKNNGLINNNDGNIPDSPSEEMSTKLYIGANINENLDFDITTLTQYSKENGINGTYYVNNELDSSYIWICVPAIYDSLYITLDSLKFSTLDPISTVVNINNTDVKYNCYRSVNKIMSAYCIIELTNL